MCSWDTTQEDVDGILAALERALSGYNELLSRLTRQPTRAISQALSPVPKQRMSSADFSRQVAHLQNLRNAL